MAVAATKLDQIASTNSVLVLFPVFFGDVVDVLLGAIAGLFRLAKPQMLSVTEFDGPRIFAQLFEGKNWMSIRI